MRGGARGKGEHGATLYGRTAAGAGASAASDLREGGGARQGVGAAKAVRGGRRAR